MDSTTPVCLLLFVVFSAHARDVISVATKTSPKLNEGGDDSVYLPDNPEFPVNNPEFPDNGPEFPDNIPVGPFMIPKFSFKTPEHHVNIPAVFDDFIKKFNNIPEFPFKTPEHHANIPAVFEDFIKELKIPGFPRNIPAVPRNFPAVPRNIPEFPDNIPEFADYNPYINYNSWGKMSYDYPETPALGTSMLIAPKDITHIINNVIGAVYDKDTGIYKVDCDSITSAPNITFIVNDKTYVIKPQDYVVQVMGSEPAFCISGFIEIPPDTAPLFLDALKEAIKKIWDFFHSFSNESTNYY